MGGWRTQRIAKTFDGKENRASLHRSVALSHGPLSIIHSMRYREAGLKSLPQRHRDSPLAQECCMLESRRRTGREFHADIACENRSEEHTSELQSHVNLVC